MDLEGVVTSVLDPVSGTGKYGAWKKQTVIIEYESGNNYTEKLALTNMRNPDQFRKLQPGERYVFKVTPMSKQHKYSWYTEVRCYAWVKIEDGPQEPAGQDMNESAEGLL